MQKFISILKLLIPYKQYAFLNIFFNLLSIVFSLFSLTMIMPVLDLLFLQSDEYIYKNITQEAPTIRLSVDAVKDYFNYYFSLTIVKNGKIDALILICVLVVVMIFFKNLFRYLAMFTIAKARTGVVKDLRSKMYRKALMLPLSFYSDEKKGDIMSRFSNDVLEVEWSILNSLEILFRDPIAILLYLGTLLYMSPKLTLFVFILLPIAGLIIGRIGKSLKKTSVKGQQKVGELMSSVEETLGGLRIIKAFNAEKFITRKFDKQNSEYNVLMTSMYRKRDLASPMSEFLGVTAMAIVLWYGGNLVLSHDSDISASTFVGYIAIFSQIINPAKAFSSAFYNIQKGIASVERINKILDAEESIKEIEHPKRIEHFKHQIEFKNVSFAYNEKYVLNNINLVIEKGKTIALVGQSGAGKSTLVDLLPRFYDCLKGEVLIDGINVKELSIHDLRSLFGVVTQESILFNDTVFNNIAFGVDNASEEAVISAAKVANAHDFITQLENGYYTNIGDRGSKLSGGQRQRISIARAVFKNPPILILDEATSALDTESERLVQEAINHLMQNRTSIVIAHRLSTIQNADEIIVMHEGKIVERGKHTELILKNGVYKKLCDLQTFS
ncbi:MAG: ABC transporter ATP-binding protein [Bacteroidia bacterium]